MGKNSRRCILRPQAVRTSLNSVSQDAIVCGGGLAQRFIPTISPLSESDALWWSNMLMRFKHANVQCASHGGHERSEARGRYYDAHDVKELLDWEKQNEMRELNI